MKVVVRFRIRKEMPKLLSPINSLDGAVEVINAGADELYCGVTIPGLEDFILYRSRVCEIPTYQELGEVLRYAHKHDVRVLITMNLPFVTKTMEGYVKKHIRSCLDEGIDALIIGNMGVLSIVKEMQVDVPLVASTFFVSMNCEAVKLLEKAGFSRIILERHLTISEISEIVHHSKVDVEVFIHNGGCSNINGSCYLLHIIYPKLFQALRGFSGINPPCTLPLDVYDQDDEKKIGSGLLVLDAFTFCSICQLPELIETGVYGFKIVGRCYSGEYIASVTRIYRQLIELFELGSKEHFQKRVESIKMGRDPLIVDSPPLFQLTQRFMCEQKRCYYRPFFSLRTVRGIPYNANR